MDDAAINDRSKQWVLFALLGPKSTDAISKIINGASLPSGMEFDAMGRREKRTPHPADRIFRRSGLFYIMSSAIRRGFAHSVY